MAREFARRVGPRGAPPDFGGSEAPKPQSYNAKIPQHTPGPQCGECKPTPCRVEGCKGWTHSLQISGGRQCGTCGERAQ